MTEIPIASDRSTEEGYRASPSWLFRMALRDSRRSRSRLLLFISSIVLGIAALVSIQSLGDTLRREIDRQAAELLGADMEISGNRPLSEPMEKLVDSLGKERTEQKSFASMAIFPPEYGSRLVQVKALGDGYPYYGRLQTVPEEAGVLFRESRSALVDKGLMMQFNVRVGDSVKLGTLTFRIAGSLEAAPGQTGLSSSVAPVVYIPIRYLPGTGLEQKGSRIRYSRFVRFDDPAEVAALTEKLEPRLEAESLDLDTVESRKERTARSFRDVNRFLSLVGFIALLLGSIGVASAIHIYMREKIGTVAVLRCLGASSRQAFLIYLIQILGIGLIGSLLGALLGSLLQQALPWLLKDLLPVRIEPQVSWTAILQGIGLGMVISLLFALAPLVSIRNVSPLNTLRSMDGTSSWRDPLTWLVYLLILGFVLAFSRGQLSTWRQAFFFTLALLSALALLTALAWLLMYAVRRFFPSGWPYVWRQGLANLYRPNNQTLVLLLSIGLGTALISTLLLMQGILLDRVTLSSSGSQPNMVLFDIQETQRDSLVRLTRKEGLPVDGTVPIVTMRLESVNRTTAATLKKDSSSKTRPWIFNREWRVTYRDSLIDSETLTEGEWVGRWNAAEGPVPISLEAGVAKGNGIVIGDTLSFNVQGSVVTTRVASLRNVDWGRIQTNFLVLFPSGVLESAPKFHVLLTRTPSVEASAAFQRKVVTEYPNVSVIELGLVLDVVDKLLDKVGFVIRFMALFCMVTGWFVLISSVLISKYQRMRESVLLRTMGASRRQIFAITALEYSFLGSLAALAGILLSLGAGWALSRYVFEARFHPQWSYILLVLIGVSAVTLLIGLANSRYIVDKAPLEILRDE